MGGSRALACAFVRVVLLIQRAAILLSAIFVASYFSTLSHKRRDFRKKIIKLKMCILTLSTKFV